MEETRGEGGTVRVFRLPDGGWVVDSGRFESEPMMGHRLPEPAPRMVRLDAGGSAWDVSPVVWSDCEYLGCNVLAVRGTDLVSTVWKRIDEEVPSRMEFVVARGLVEVAAAEFPYAAEAEAALRAR